MKTRYAVLIIFSLIAMATTAFANSNNADQCLTQQQRAEQILSKFQQQLKAELMTGLKQGPQQAIAVCQDKAPQIAASLSSATTQLGRTSHKLRNAANQPPAWVKPLLNNYRQTPQLHIAQQLILDNGDFGYVKPIYVQPPCLKCHGGNIDPQLQAELSSRYPSDNATGFRKGDFRGLFWVRLSKESS